jgi:hypothetical protein
VTSALAATLRVSLRRTRAAWPIVLAAGVTCLLATTLLASGPIYADAVSLSGLHRVLTDAPVADSNIEVSLRADPAAIDDIDAAVIAEAGRTVGELGGTVTRFGRSETFDLPVPAGGPVETLAVIGYAEGLQDVATLADGSWPTDRVGAASGPVSVVVARQVAEPLGLAVGDVMSLTSRIESDLVVPVRIDGIFSIDDPSAPYWWDEAMVLDGVVTTDAFATYGPFLTTRTQFLERSAVRRLQFGWRILPTIENLTAEGIAPFRVRVDGLRDRLTANVVGSTVAVETGLPVILGDAERSLLVSRTGVLVLVIQLAVVAAYAVLLSASLLVDHRRVDTAMLRSRGAGPTALIVLALSEGLLLTVPAAILGPPLAVIALHAFNIVGPLADIGLRLDPVLTPMAFVAAAAGAAACLLALVVPAWPSRRSFASARGGARSETRPAGQRFGLDLARLGVAAIGLWPLRFFGAPLTQTVQGELGIDPLLVAAPAIGLIAGAVLALRLLPWLAHAIERATSRGRGLVSSLGARQLARRPLRYTRSALLLMLAMAMGVFAVSYAWTWTSSQRDQATFQVGADVRVTPGDRSGSPPDLVLGPAYDALPGVDARMAVDRASIRVTRSAAELLALDAVVAPSVVTIRDDLHPASLDRSMARLADARPGIALPRLPDGTRNLRLTLRAAIRAVERPAFDEELGLVNEPVDPVAIADHQGLRVAVVVRDASGLLYRSIGEAVELDGAGHEVVIPLDVDAVADLTAIDEPLELVGVEASVTVPTGLQITDATISIGDIATSADVSGVDPIVDWQPLDHSSPGGWRLTSSVYGQPPIRVDALSSGPTLSADVGTPGLGAFPGADLYGRGTTVSFAPARLDELDRAAIPAVVTVPFLEATGRSVGDSVSIDVAGVRRTFEIVDAVSAFPTIEATLPAIIADLPTIAMLRYEGSGLAEPAGEWWLDLDDATTSTAHADLVEVLLADPIGSRTVLSQVDRARALETDPVALGIIGALGIGAVAAALFAIVGFTVSAGVSARERVTEFALLRALGLSSGQLSRWLSLENAVLAAVSLVAGTALGLLIAWIVLPFVSVTRDARTPYPPVTLDVPWSVIGGLVLIGLITLSVVVFGLSHLLRRVGLVSALRVTDE